MDGEPTKRNQNLYFHYHQDRGHTIEECRTLQAFLNKLIKASKLKQFLQQLDSYGNQFVTEPQRSGAPQSSLGIINDFFETPRRESHLVNGVMLVSPPMAGSREEAHVRGLEFQSNLSQDFLRKTSCERFYHTMTPWW